MLENAPLVNATTLDAEFKNCDLVIEAVIENLDAKRQLYARIEPQLAADAILATNTSTIPISRLAEGLKNPQRFCGIHFFNPVRQMPLVEVIRGSKTSDETVATAVAFAKSIGKSPIVVNDGPGFLVNRLLLPYMNEALELLLDGADMQQIEKAAQKFGMPMGPFTLYDVVGLDTAFYAGHVMYEAFPDRVVTSPLLPAMVEAKRLGQKTGVGFYKYAGGKKGKGEPDPTLESVVAPHRRSPQKFNTEQIQNRLFLPMVLEATRILEEKVVRDPRDVDLGLIFGTGFPPFKGGLLFWADQIGAAKIVEMLKPLESLGARAKPTPMLQDLAAKGSGFYSLAGA
jgi:3-hydroxyacyl-CoA dehydrogenase/enoyl-CoA hydratase/3-hydroxybutyryl-CoA epimerase/3-hydroxyacyl-CoA dehydrogenase/enoyl-CoA hydratase/3-hydroxybutyryl-CoA epimerase/enoyl-CoA isomerase